MASFNQATIMGNLGQDPEVRYLPNGNAVANLSVATTENWKDKDGNKQEKTVWHRVVIHGKTAEVAGEYLKKGNSVLIQGRIENREYEGKDGTKKFISEIVASDMRMLGMSKNGLGEQKGAQSQPAGPKPYKSPSELTAHGSGALDSDDIPF